MSTEVGATIERDYGAKVVAVEPGGIERIPEGERHGRPLQLAWTFSSPNLEFATLFVGVLAVQVFGLSFWPAVAAIVLGNLLGSVAQGLLAAQGPSGGVPQMVLGRLAFGYRGNVLPAGLMTITSGFGWIAVNSVSASFALNSLTGLPLVPCLVVVIVLEIGVAFFGHNLVQAFERYVCPLLAVIFAVGAVVVLTHFDPSAPPPAGGAGGVGGVPARVRHRVQLRRQLEPLRRRLRPLPAGSDVQAAHRSGSGGGPVPGHHHPDDRRGGVGQRSHAGGDQLGQPDHRLRRSAAARARRADPAGDRARRRRGQCAQRLLRCAGLPQPGFRCASAPGPRGRRGRVRRDRVRHRAVRVA